MRHSGFSPRSIGLSVLACGASLLILAALMTPAGADAAECPAQPADAYSLAVLADSPLAYYRLDESAGPTICDSSAGLHNGTYSGGMSFGLPGAPSGSDTAIAATEGIGNGATGVAGSHDFTMEGWFRRTSTTQDQALVAMGSAEHAHIAGLTAWTTTGGEYAIKAASTVGLDTYLGINQWDTAPAGVNLWDGQWHYLAVSYSSASSQATVYVDGHDLGAQTTPALNITSAPILLGHWVDTTLNKSLRGGADEIAVYPTALSASRIAAHYAAAGIVPGGKRASATQVNCTLQSPDTPSAFFECTAQLGDASGQQPPKIPGGSVTFALNAGGGGGFRGSSTCNLSPSQTGGASSFCSVIYLPPSAGIPIGAQPPITATYPGDSTFSASSASPHSAPGEPQPETEPVLCIDLPGEICKGVGVALPKEPRIDGQGVSGLTVNCYEESASGASAHMASENRIGNTLPTSSEGVGAGAGKVLPLGVPKNTGACKIKVELQAQKHQQELARKKVKNLERQLEIEERLGPLEEKKAKLRKELKELSQTWGDEEPATPKAATAARRKARVRHWALPFGTVVVELPVHSHRTVRLQVPKRERRFVRLLRLAHVGTLKLRLRITVVRTGDHKATSHSRFVTYRLSKK